MGRITVIVEHKGSGEITEITTSKYDKINRMASRIEEERKRMNTFPAMEKSQWTEPLVTDLYYLREPSDTKCWKNQKHAVKNWMRHQHRFERTGGYFPAK